jgi:hypothetical protein
MAHEVRSIEDLKRPELQELRDDQRIKSRMLVLNLITLMLFASAIAFAVLIGLGLIPRQQHDGFEPWVVLVGVAILEIPVMYFVVNMQLPRLKKAKSLGEAMAAGQVSYILGLAFAESITIYALVGAPMGMPLGAQFGLWGFGFAVMIGVVLWLRPKILNKLILILANEKRAAASKR